MHASTEAGRGATTKAVGPSSPDPPPLTGGRRLVAAPGFSGRRPVLGGLVAGEAAQVVGPGPQGDRGERDLGRCRDRAGDARPAQAGEWGTLLETSATRSEARLISCRLRRTRMGTVGWSLSL